MSSPLAQFKTAVTDKGLEDQFLKLTGLSSLDELSPDNFREMSGKAESITATIGVPSAAPLQPKEVHKSEADARPVAQYEEASDFLYGFKHISIRYAPRRQTSNFFPSAQVMYLILHQMNLVLCDHFYFLRSAPDYHPALLRIYFGVCFIIQSLRAQHAANNLTGQDQYDFLKRFLDAYPAETLAIPAPLLHVFKALCASQPEIPQYGLVCPIIPTSIGPSTLKLGPTMTYGQVLYPDIAGILSLLHWQAASKDYAKGFHPTFSTTSDTTFRGFVFSADPTTWTSLTAWSLRFPGIEHPFESGKKLNENFFDDRYSDLALPPVTGDTRNSTASQFLFLSGNISWFSKLRDIAGVSAKYFPGSGSLADCSPIGLPIGQVISNLVAPATLPTQPTGFTQDPSYHNDIEFKLTTTSRSLPQLAAIIAAASQVNMRYYKTHPGLGNYRSMSTGLFWDIRPIESAPVEDSVFFGMSDSIKKAIKDKA